jgi:hypothetical protein
MSPVGKDKENKSLSGKIEDEIVPVDPPHLIDCQNLSRMQLRKKYPGEANSHKHMLEREPKLGRTIHPQFRDFRSFLRHVGPKPFPQATLVAGSMTTPNMRRVRFAGRTSAHRVTIVATRCCSNPPTVGNSFRRSLRSSMALNPARYASGVKEVGLTSPSYPANNCLHRRRSPLSTR